MGKLSMCRICLSDDIPMRSIVRTPLQEVYESLTTMPFVTENIRPVVVCTLCCARLENSLELKEKCLQSEKLFAELQLNNVQVNLQVMPDAHLSTEGVIQMTPNVFGNDEVKQENAEDGAAVGPASSSECDVPLCVVKEERDDVDTDDVAVEQDDADPYHSALGSHKECDIPMDIVKEEPDDIDTDDVAVERASNSEWDLPLSVVKNEPDVVETGDAAVEQDGADPYHSALGLHTECDIPLDIVKEEPDDVDTGINTHSEHGRCAPATAGEEKLVAFLVVKYPSQDPEPSGSLPTDDEHRRLHIGPKTSAERERAFRARQALLKQQRERRENARDSAMRALERRARSAEATRRWREKKKGSCEAANKQ